MHAVRKHIELVPRDAHVGPLEKDIDEAADDHVLLCPGASSIGSTCPDADDGPMRPGRLGIYDITKCRRTAVERMKRHSIHINPDPTTTDMDVIGSISNVDGGLIVGAVRIACAQKAKTLNGAAAAHEEQRARFSGAKTWARI